MSNLLPIQKSAKIDNLMKFNDTQYFFIKYQIFCKKAVEIFFFLKNLLSYLFRRHLNKQLLYVFIQPIQHGKGVTKLIFKQNKVILLRDWLAYKDQRAQSALLFIHNWEENRRIYALVQNEMQPATSRIWTWLVGWVLWHINLCRLFNVKSIFM